jgi:ABC-type lipoprotein release transport system permease subunit
MLGSIFSVFIVLLGIYALVSHNMLSRTKEIGILKVMGGSTLEMMILIYLSTLKWTLIASAIAVPLSLLYLGRWLNDYTVRIEVRIAATPFNYFISRDEKIQLLSCNYHANRFPECSA